MLMKGTAWAQIKGSEAALLSDPEKGVDVLLASVATWEENSELQTYDKFERALYKVIQRNDETTLSYVNRLNVAFTELGQVDIADMRAFILLRQSALQAEDKKKVITLTGGELTAKKVEGAMRSLSTKVLGGQTDQKKKTYPINFVDEDHEEIYHVGDDDGWDEETILQSLVEQGDEDAQTVSDFEDQLIDVCQESSELSLSVFPLMPMPEPGFVTSFEPVASGLPPRVQKAVVEKGEVSRELARRRTRPLPTE